MSAHEDAVALLATQHLVTRSRREPGELGVTDVKTATLATLLMQGADADATELSTKPVVEGEKLSRDVGDQHDALGPCVGLLS